jgi:hypothetical protein
MCDLARVLFSFRYELNDTKLQMAKSDVQRNGTYCTSIEISTTMCCACFPTSWPVSISQDPEIKSQAMRLSFVAQDTIVRLDAVAQSHEAKFQPCESFGQRSWRSSTPRCELLHAFSRVSSINDLFAYPIITLTTRILYSLLRFIA